jgi:hypothetical protein
MAISSTSIIVVGRETRGVARGSARMHNVHREIGLHLECTTVDEASTFV